MKRIVALILTALMLFTGVSMAEELPIMEQYPQNVFYNEVFMTPQTMPSVVISCRYADSLVGYKPYYEPIYTCFDYPAGATPMEFDTRSCTVYDEAAGVVYTYEQTESSAFETFTAKAEEGCVIADGTNGYAVYVKNGTSKYGYGLIAVPEQGKTAKLYIKMQFVNKFNATNEELGAIVEAEVLRVMNSLKVSQIDQYWSKGKYSGFSMCYESSSDPQIILDYTFKPLTLKTSTGAVETAVPYVTGMQGGRVNLMMNFDTCSIKAEITLDSYSYPDRKREDEPDNVSMVILEDGNLYEIYNYNLERLSSPYVCRKLYKDGVGYKGEDAYFLTVDLGTTNYTWTSIEEMCEFMSQLFGSIELNDNGNPFYTTEEALADGEFVDYSMVEIEGLPTAPAANGDEDEGWNCPVCNKEKNTGNFCSACGAAKPEPEPEEETGWTCSCGQKNEGNFCSNCGQKKPEPEGPWTCSCGQKNEGNFCSNCGQKKP